MNERERERERGKINKSCHRNIGPDDVFTVVPFLRRLDETFIQKYFFGLFHKIFIQKLNYDVWLSLTASPFNSVVYTMYWNNIRSKVINEFN